MSKRRKPGEIVRRKPGSGFVGSQEPEFVKVPEGEAYLWCGLNEGESITNEHGTFTYDPEWPSSRKGEASPCMLNCDDPQCREWANLEIVGGEFNGEHMCHIAECEMEDLQAHEITKAAMAVLTAARKATTPEG